MGCRSASNRGIALLFASPGRRTSGKPFWRWPLRATVFSCSVTFAIGPVLSFLEGCGLVPEAGYLGHAFFNPWSRPGLHGSPCVYSPRLVRAGGCARRAGYRRLQSVLCKAKPIATTDALARGWYGAIHWRREVFGFQEENSGQHPVRLLHLSAFHSNPSSLFADP